MECTHYANGIRDNTTFNLYRHKEDDIIDVKYNHEE
jgi:hypothetical protein